MSGLPTCTADTAIVMRERRDGDGNVNGMDDGNGGVE